MIDIVVDHTDIRISREAIDVGAMVKPEPIDI